MTRIDGVAPSDGRLDVLVGLLVDGLSRSRASTIVKEGRVTVEGLVLAKPAQTVHRGARVSIDVPDAIPDRALPQDLPIRVVYEDPDVVVVDKEPGMVVHPGAGHADGTLVNALLHHVEDLSGIGGVERPGIVHRLDRGTSGLIVVAKNDAAHHGLADQFAAHTAGRTYLAITLVAPETNSGTITSELARSPRDRMKFASTTFGGGRHAVTHWRVLARGLDGVAMIGCQLETGRTHQIRVHMSEAGWPLAGDDVYAKRRVRTPAWLAEFLPEDRPMLHAFRLRFTHPRDGRACQFEAPVPDDFAAALAAAELVVPDPLPTIKG
jgi:23S rRNA pseudouridine1911/1915/1917 synthase